MDFALIKDHPWTTAGIVFGGGFLLFVVMRRGGSSTAAQPAYSSPTTATDPNAAAIAVQQSQMQTYVAGLQLQGATQISLATIGADVSKFSTTASVDVTDNQTAAQLALGLGTLNASVEQSRIDAGIQNHYIDAIVAAFTGHPTAPTSVSTPNSPQPTNQTAPYVPQIVYAPPGGTGGGNPVTIGGINPGTSYPGMPLPGATPVQYSGGPILAPPSFANCDPHDVACVMNNQNIGINYQQSSINANAVNNRNQCLANAALSQGAANYPAIVAACG